jgi:phospholipase C
MENEEASAVIGNRHAPFINSLASRYALATRYYAIAHPSLPNYLALTGGSTFGVSSDCTSCSVGGRSVADQLQDAHVSWKAYMESMSRSCDTSAGNGSYAKKHDPFVYYRRLVADRRRCSHVVPYPQLGADLVRGSLPTFAWITPNLCDDGHDCSLATADRYLARVVPALVRELGPHGLLLLVWDEGTSDAGCCGGQAAGGRVAAIVAGPDVRPGARSAIPYDHYSALRTIEDALRVPHLGRAGSPATAPLDALFSAPPRVR